MNPWWQSISPSPQMGSALYHNTDPGLNKTCRSWYSFRFHRSICHAKPMPSKWEFAVSCYSTPSLENMAHQSKHSCSCIITFEVPDFVLLFFYSFYNYYQFFSNLSSLSSSWLWWKAWGTILEYYRVEDRPLLFNGFAIGYLDKIILVSFTFFPFMWVC